MQILRAEGTVFGVLFRRPHTEHSIRSPRFRDMAGLIHVAGIIPHHLGELLRLLVLGEVMCRSAIRRSTRSSM